ncbi:MAG: divalent metal cation transporter [Acidobacteriales bacterium]|nr:divalent metal cation transporter [Terriglobales bacterium]
MTATVIGAAYQFSLLWLVLLCIPILITIFDVSARIGHETHQGLVELLREQYGMWLGVVCAVLIVLINMAMIVADSVAVTDAMSIVLGEKRQVFIVLVSFVVWYILIFRDYRRIVRFMVWAAMPLFAYVVSAVISGPDLKILAQGVLFPRVAPTPDYAAAILGIFGSLLTPYLLVWQTSSRREMATHGPVQMGSAEHRFGGMITILLSFCIIVSAASVLHLTSPTDMSTSDAAKALTPAVGGLGSILFAVGIIGSGFVALPILVASMCYSVAEAFGWNYGLSEHPWEAKRFYVMISFSMLFAAAANLVGVNPVKLLYLSQVLAGVLAIPILVFILLLSNDRRVMRTTNSRWQNFWIGAASGGLLATGGMVLFLKLFT